MPEFLFPYFQGPTNEMSWLLKGTHPCSLCNKVSTCFQLTVADCPGLGNSEKKNQKGCLDCLRSGAFEFEHDTEFGFLKEDGFRQYYRNHRQAPAGFSADARRALRRSPGFTTWQGQRWLGHCNDFMVYQGTWVPADFSAHAEDGDGLALFLAMTEPDEQHLWDESCRSPGQKLTDWHATYYSFQCRHCRVRRGNWDCD